MIAIIRQGQRTPIVDSWGPGTLTPPDRIGELLREEEENPDMVICGECPREIDMCIDKHAVCTDWRGEPLIVCEECADMLGVACKW